MSGAGMRLSRSLMYATAKWRTDSIAPCTPLQSDRSHRRWRSDNEVWVCRIYEDTPDFINTLQCRNYWYLQGPTKWRDGKPYEFNNIHFNFLGEALFAAHAREMIVIEIVKIKQDLREMDDID